MLKKLWNSIFRDKVYELTIQYANKEPVVFNLKSISKLTQKQVKGVDVDGRNIDIMTTEPFDYLLKSGYNQNEE